MKNKNLILGVLGAVAITAGVVGWLVFGSKPIDIDAKKKPVTSVSSTLKNTTISREQDGKKLWEISVDEVDQNMSTRIATMKGIKGKIYRKDGSYVDISSKNGRLNTRSNDFVLENEVKAVLNTGGILTAKKVSWMQKKETLTATGNVKIVKDGYTLTGNNMTTTSAFEDIKVKGKAKLEKGGK